jgi:hypothetical protein
VQLRRQPAYPGKKKFIVYFCLFYFILFFGVFFDSQHIQENKDYYTGDNANATRRWLYRLWKEINKTEMINVSKQQVNLNLDQYLLINNARDPREMSTQQTGNTCYFQTYLFAVLCKVCKPTCDGSDVQLQNVDQLAEVTVSISRFLLQFFVEDGDANAMRPLTNSNFVCDFHRFTQSAYYPVVTKYLQRRSLEVPDYQLQFSKVTVNPTTGPHHPPEPPPP